MSSEAPPTKRSRQEPSDPPTMEVETTADALRKRWAPLEMILSRPSQFGMETGALQYAEGMSFEPDADLHSEISQACILCVGAGGLGCEILKDLALTGFTNIHVIDLDTIDVTNLNRQFLFRLKDVGRSKSEVAAEFVNRRVPGVNVVPHVGKLQDHPTSWYSQFNVVIAGLDNLEARRFLNETLCQLVRYEDGEIDPSSVIPLIDGGTEGLKGQARVILPKKTSCFECTMNLFPPARGKAVCTLENHPRVPADCAIYIFMKIDDKKEGEGEEGAEEANHTFIANDQVFITTESIAGIVLERETPEGATDAVYRVRVVDSDGMSERTAVPESSMVSIRQHWLNDFGDIKMDKDSREHMTWVHERASDRAKLFNIEGLTYDKTMGAVKNIIPAVASTNAVIAAACVNEALKCLTFSGQLCNTYMLYNGQSVGSGVDCNTLIFEKLQECPACGQPPAVEVKVSSSITVKEFVEYLKVNDLVSPKLDTPLIYDSEGDAFYVTTGPLARMKAANLPQPLTDFVDNGETLLIMDSSWGKDIKRHVKVSYA